MSKITLAADPAGTATFTVAAPGTSNNQTITLPDGTGTLELMQRGTAVASTSGTSIDFTGIPAWAKRITVMFRGVSTNGLTDLLVQIGSGAFQTTGYASACGYMGTGNTASVNSSTSGFNMVFGNAAQIASGIMTLVHMGGNIWVASVAGKLTAVLAVAGGGDVALSGVLDRLRITTNTGTDVFDAGSVNVMWEG